ncbi:cupin domain-containing protein [Prevotella sp.]|uniref:cupin domain-containing protein n=1 Tax=Prevotella sp. TaxID=59823 RepID=UPI003DA1F60D
MKNFKKTTVEKDAARTELHELLNLTGSEISVNTMPAGGQIPFVHQHTKNEEVYTVLSGKGIMNIDDEDITLNVGDWLRVDASAKRQLRAADDSAITYICIQTKAGSIGGFTANDAIIL